VVDGAVAEHLEVLGDVPALPPGVIEGLGKAESLDWRLGDALDAGGGSMPSASSTVGTMSMACAYWVRTSPGLDAGGPVDDERIADAAAVGLALPAAERGVARPGPAPGIVVEILGPPSSSMAARFSSSDLGHVVEEQVSLTEPWARPRSWRRCRR
jgi:hypothetical protein